MGFFSGWTPADWAALGSVTQAAATVAAVVVALVAVIYAKRQWTSAQAQIHEARVREEERKEERARPFVVVDFEPSAASGNLIDLVIENVGATLAKNVRFQFDPELVSSMDTDGGYGLSKSVLFTHGIPALPPGKRISALFDVSHKRLEAGLPPTFRVTVHSEDAQGRAQEPLEYVLDLNFRYGLRRVDVKTVHDVAKSMKEIEKAVGRWTQHFDGIRVWVRDEDAYLARVEEDYRAMRATEDIGSTTSEGAVVADGEPT